MYYYRFLKITAILGNPYEPAGMLLRMTTLGTHLFSKPATLEAYLNAAQLQEELHGYARKQ